MRHKPQTWDAQKTSTWITMEKLHQAHHILQKTKHKGKILKEAGHGGQRWGKPKEEQRQRFSGLPVINNVGNRVKSNIQSVIERKDPPTQNSPSQGYYPPTAKEKKTLSQKKINRGTSPLVVLP